MTPRATTRERILDASRRLFNEKDYTAATLAEIQSIAWREAQIKPDIIEMRMTDFDKM